MPDSTKPSGSSDKLHDAFIRLTNQQLSLGESMNFMTHKIDELFHRVSPLLTTSPPIPSSLSHSSPAPALNHRMKLDVPRFDGTDPLGWIFKINQFFEYHSTREHDCLTIASFYMEGCALAWFQWMTGNSQFTSWSFSSRPCKLDSHRGSTRILSGPYSSWHRREKWCINCRSFDYNQLGPQGSSLPGDAPPSTKYILP